MDLTLSEEQQAVREAFADLFAKESGSERVRAAEPLGHDPALWATLVRAGAPTMGVPEDLGGGGAATLDLAVVAIELGRRVAPAPLLEVFAAVDVLARLDPTPGLVDDVGAGTVLPTLALRPARDGVAPGVPAAAVADLVVVLDGDELVALRRDPGPGPANVGSAPLADVVLADAHERRVLATGDAARAAHADGVALWRTLMASALWGLGQEALALGVAYAKDRQAFGVPIGWFQSVAHRLADVATAGEGAELLVLEAAWARDTGDERAAALAGMALLFAAENAVAASRASLQFHGGYGVSLEYDIQLYYRRAKAWPLALGAPRHEYRALTGLLFGADTAEAS